MNIATELSKRFVERSEALGYKGKARDKAALDYFVGAACLAEIQGDEKAAQHLGMIAAMIVSVRGYFTIKEMATRKDRI